MITQKMASLEPKTRTITPEQLGLKTLYSPEGAKAGKIEVE
jgi:hypothetical protein